MCEKGEVDVILPCATCILLNDKDNIIADKSMTKLRPERCSVFLKAKD